MSQNPYASPTPLADPASYGTPGKPTAPVAGIVLGILHLLYAAFTCVCNGTSGLVFVLKLPPEMTQGNAAFELMSISPLYKVFCQASLIVSLLAALMLAVAACGLLQVRPYGRKLSIYYCLYDFISITLHLVVDSILLYPMLLEQINTLPSGHPESVGAYFGLIGGLVWIGFTLIYPVVVITFMYRPKMIAAYGGS